MVLTPGDVPIPEVFNTKGFEEIVTIEFDIYPNPIAFGNLNILVNGYDEIGKSSIIISNGMGQEVQRFDLNELDSNIHLTIPIDDYSSGMYIVQLATSRGISVERFIIER